MSRLNPLVLAGGALAVVGAVALAPVLPSSVVASANPPSAPVTAEAPDTPVVRGEQTSRSNARPVLPTDAQVAHAVALVDARETARAKKLAAEAKKAKAAAKARAVAKAQGYEPGVTDPKTMARQIAKNKFGWGSQEFACYNNIIMRESMWDPKATNPSSRAYGIPQALPASKMGTIASDWKTNPATQIRWGLKYVEDRYGSPCQAWSFKSANGWY